MNLELIGWNIELQQAAQPFTEQGLVVGRVILEHKGLYRVMTEQGELVAEVTGKLRFEAEGIHSYPSVGDWVLLKARYEEGKGTIHTLLPRKTKFSRKIAGTTTEEQIVAANIDLVFLVTALNQDFNLRRLERYLILAWESGARPIILLSKADLCDDVEEKLQQVESIAFGVPIHVISSYTGQGMNELVTYLGPGVTVALLGSSGVGKSSLINALYGREIQRVNDIRQGDDRGKHTTTHRELIMLEQGGVLIDTPGMREIQLWESSQGFSESFQDVEQLAEACHFTDCQHKSEPQCAVRQAIEEGLLAEERFISYQKMQRELAHLEKRNNLKARLENKKNIKRINQAIKQKKKMRKR